MLRGEELHRRSSREATAFTRHEIEVTSNCADAPSPLFFYRPASGSRWISSSRARAPQVVAAACRRPQSDAARFEQGQELAAAS